MHAAATLTLTTQFLDRAHALDAAQWQHVARRATGLHIARILETILADWSLEDRVRAVGPQRRLFARHLGSWAARLLPSGNSGAQPADRVFGAGAAHGRPGAIDAAVLAALAALDQSDLLGADAAQALYAPFQDAIPLQSLITAAPPASAAAGIEAALASYGEERLPGFGLRHTQSRGRRRTLAVRRALTQQAAAEAGPRGPRDQAPAPARKNQARKNQARKNQARQNPAWLSDLTSYRPTARGAAAWITMAVGLGLVGFAIFGFRGGDATNSIAPVSGAVVSPAVLNPIAPDEGIAPPADAMIDTTIDRAPPSVGEGPVTSGALPAPERVGRVPAPVTTTTPATDEGVAAADGVGGNDSTITGNPTDAASPTGDASQTGEASSAGAAIDDVACADGACWLAMGAVYEADEDWARSAAAYAAAAKLDAADDATGEARVRAGLIRALHPAQTAAAVPAAAAMSWLDDALASARAAAAPAHSPLLLQAAIDSLFAERSAEFVTAAAYQVVNVAPLPIGGGQLTPVGQLMAGDRFLPIGRCSDPNGHWMAVWIQGSRDGQILRGWVNLQLANSAVPPLLGSQQANSTLQAGLPLLEHARCAF